MEVITWKINGWLTGHYLARLLSQHFPEWWNNISVWASIPDLDSHWSYFYKVNSWRCILKSLVAVQYSMYYSTWRALVYRRRSRCWLIKVTGGYIVKSSLQEHVSSQWVIRVLIPTSDLHLINTWYISLCNVVVGQILGRYLQRIMMKICWHLLYYDWSY